MFEVAYETTFCAVHRLTRDGEPIEPLHGHDWKLEVVAVGEGLDEVGVLLDFDHLRHVVSEVAQGFHYRDLNEHSAFAELSPSTEVVARYIFQEVRARLGPEGKMLRRVRVWEAPGCSATYQE